MITSPNNEKIKFIRLLQTQRKAREEQQLFVVEGVRLAEEAIKAGVAPKFLFHTYELDKRGQAAVSQWTRLGAEQVEVVSPSALAAASDTQTPSGLLAVLPFPALWVMPSTPFAIALDRIADPGNLGTILRTALAVGAGAAFLLPGTVDAYNPKVVRSALGAHFRLPILELSWDDLKRQQANTEAWLADVGEGQPYDKVDWKKPVTLIIGSEAEGPSEAARAFAIQRAHIPMPGSAESLNAAVAAGVLMFEIARQRRASIDSPAPTG